MIKTPLRAVIWMGLVLVLSSCATVDSRVYLPDQLKIIKPWLLEFAYESGEVEQLQKNSGDSEVKIVSKGQSPTDLQLRDDLFFTLKDDYSVPLTKKPAEAAGRIQIHPLHFYSGGFRLLTVTLVDRQGETLARLKIENGDVNGTFKDNDDFTRYAAKAIAKALDTEPVETTDFYP